MKKLRKRTKYKSFEKKKVFKNLPKSQKKKKKQERNQKKYFFFFKSQVPQPVYFRKISGEIFHPRLESSSFED